ncbi:demethylmenaquinone methyltransferase [Luteimicrobium subarcticum]|uniref:Demethylmenaquinone methyltransferase n=1 Tax=Luteimicrobium subarcticum TaxID=620910 RepID=A0A2M8WVR0_9MICO|nr:demethylmenaquinone methyltransferase [Luteimicrobium subarcticum]PJI94993.1 demethylmenaquinone methyltransferase/2-methoxy-6-polyprenyl-1,4-benzoquinol methylase [Luteimicrobium subarcticum]
MPRAGLDKTPSDVASMFDGIARRYDLANDVLSLGQDRGWRRATVRAVAARPGETVLDLAAGTGTSSEPYADANVRVVPCDLSVGMLAVGRRRSPDLPFVAGDATALPFADASFDAVTISFGLRNVVDVHGALREMRRVVRPGGRLVVCEFSTPTWEPFRRVYQEYLVAALPKVAGALTRDEGSYDYLAESITAWPDQLGLSELLYRSGWSQVGYRNLTGGVVALHRATRPADDVAADAS